MDGRGVKPEGYGFFSARFSLTVSRCRCYKSCGFIQKMKELAMQELLGFFDTLPWYSWVCAALLAALLAYYFGVYRRRQ